MYEVEWEGVEPLMARNKGARIKSMSDASVNEMSVKGPGYISKKKMSGQICGVDTDAERMTKRKK